MRKSPTVISLAALVIAVAALIVPPGTHIGEHVVAGLEELGQQPWIWTAIWAAVGILVLLGLATAVLAWTATRTGPCQRGSRK
ncbi:hypothetical protein [Amycolatopsis rubida]|uniref:Uncharacterized protein n=1 Tax=Amycolatopsis rubida TaxID=112413 RepID=A0A1I5XFV3_9PSEU|nr:hypothetical protein [Amycolatopsis rubida]SFQ30839.1 hypothetical protein SAMN05421854_110204 [Amycolatopsis rubida]